MAVVQVVLTGSESRRLISRAVSRLEEVGEALGSHRIILGSSSKAPDILEALGFGPIPAEERGLYVCGMIRAEGLCTTDFDVVRDVTLIEGGSTSGRVSREVLDSLGPGDVYIKSPNILGSRGRAGVLAGAPNCGFVGHMVFERGGQGLSFVAPTLLLKSAPVDLSNLEETVDQGSFRREASALVGYSCGMSVNLVPLPEETRVITEIEAIRALFGLEARPMGMSGVGSGSDAIALSVRGPDEGVEAFWEYLCSIKGTPGISTHPSDCSRCPDAKDPRRCGGYLA